MTNKSFSAAAFSLLELLLVLAIIGVLAVSAISAYQQHIQRVKVEKTALQMQSLLEAAQNVYLASNPNQWPQKPSDLDTYLYKDVMQYCPWSAPSANTCYQLSPPGSPSFYIKITIPSTQAGAAQIAKSLVARLPVAQIDPSDPNTVLAYPTRFASPPPPDVDISQQIAIIPFISGTSLKLLPCTSAKLPILTVFLTLGGADNWNYELSSGPYATDGDKWHYTKAGVCEKNINFADPCLSSDDPNYPARSSVCNPRTGAKGHFVNPYVIDRSDPSQTATSLTPYICSATASFLGEQIQAKSIQGIAIETCTAKPNP